MGAAEVGAILVPYGYTVADPAATPENSRFHHRTGVQIPDRHRRALAPLGQSGAAGAGVVALSLSALRPALGVGFLEALHPFVGSARVRPLDCCIHERHGMSAEPRSYAESARRRERASLATSEMLVDSAGVKESRSIAD